MKLIYPDIIFLSLYGPQGTSHANRGKIERPRFYACPYYLQVKSSSGKTKVKCYRPDNIFRIIYLWETEERTSLMLVVKGGPKSNLSEILYLSLLSAALIESR